MTKLESPTWDIMICSIPHRDDLMLPLLEVIDAQIGDFYPHVRVICFRDNLQTPYGIKLGTMTAASQADYVSSVDDDDMIAPHYIRRCWAAMLTWPDYVGFRVRYTVDGKPGMPVTHSLKYHEWANTGGAKVRDISEKNPIRREIAALGTWGDNEQPDVIWANSVRNSTRCKSEVFIDEEMYYYRFRSSDYFGNRHNRPPATAWNPLPEYPWLRHVGMP